MCYDFGMNYKDITQALIEEANYISPRLQKLTYDLIKMVETDQIEAFSYREGLKGANNHIVITVTTKIQKENIQLGFFKDIVAEHMPENLSKKLKEFNDYLNFANKHYLGQLPLIKIQTYYSINAKNRLGNYQNFDTDRLLPSFMNDELKQNKKIKP